MFANLSAFQKRKGRSEESLEKEEIALWTPRSCIRRDLLRQQWRWCYWLFVQDKIVPVAVFLFNCTLYWLFSSSWPFSFHPSSAHELSQIKDDLMSSIRLDDLMSSLQDLVWTPLVFPSVSRRAFAISHFAFKCQVNVRECAPSPRGICTFLSWLEEAGKIFVSCDRLRVPWRMQSRGWPIPRGVRRTCYVV